jgi:opacity protein-like surface antigen
MNRVIVVSLAALTLTAASFAQASQPKGLSFRAGLFLPSNGAARDEAPTWLAAGLDYRLGYMGQRTMANREVATFTSLSVDYYGSGKYSAIPVMFNFTARQDALYGSVGGGLGIQRQPEPGGSEGNTRFTFQLSVGYDFVRSNMPYFLEARYWGSSSAQHSGFGVYGGIRF